MVQSAERLHSMTTLNVIKCSVTVVRTQHERAKAAKRSCRLLRSKREGDGGLIHPERAAFSIEVYLTVMFHQ